jgi:type IV pilus assembly protein PilW
MLSTSRRRRQSGLSIVELLVGVTVGLFLVGGAITMFVANVKTSRQMLLEARVNQDLRAAADIIARDLRRAGFWEFSYNGTNVDTGGANAPSNGYAGITLGTNEITYTVARDTPNGRQSNLSALNTVSSGGDENFGFKLESNTLKMLVGGSWQPLTDPNIITINNFEVTDVSPAAIDIREACAKTCTTNCPTIKVRAYQILLKGTATHDSAVTRVLKEKVRVRTEQASGACPA